MSREKEVKKLIEDIYNEGLSDSGAMLLLLQSIAQSLAIIVDGISGKEEKE